MSKEKKQQDRQKSADTDSVKTKGTKQKVKLIAPANVVGVLELYEKQYLNGEVAELTETELQTLKYGSSWNYEEVK